ncbi:PAS domain-containing protein [Ideonella sp.]|uniref:PAS domain-containing sensor histidine kinase n=1 Tax=Ideonella sp. TaxID=1929293 RepID=UPI0035B43A6F
MSVPHEALFRHSPNAYMVLDRQMRYLEVNTAYELLTGRRRDELLGRGLFEIFPGTANDDGSAQADVLRASIERAFTTGERDTLALIPYAIEARTADGPVVDQRYWSATHTPLRNAQGEVVAVMQHTTDVTEVQRLREELQRARAATGLTADQLAEGVRSRAAVVQQDNIRLSASQRFLTELFAQAPGFMAVLRGPAHVFELANAAYLQLVDRQAVVGRPVRDVLPELAGQGFFELLDAVYRSGEPHVGRGVPVRLRAREAPREIFVDFVYQPLRGPGGEVEGLFVQGADVTGREAALAALRESEARFRTIANLLPHMLWSTRPDGHHDWYNQRWYDFTGVPEGSTDGDAWSGMFHPDDQPRAWARWRHSLATGEPYEVEYRLRDRAGEYRWVLGRALPVRDEDGRITRWMGSCTVIHEIKEVQARLEHSEQALRDAGRQKDLFLAALAHELRNPLAPIGTSARLILLAPERVDSVRHAAGIIDRQATHMRHLVEDLLDVSRVTRGLATLQKRPMQLREALDMAVEQTAASMAARGHRLDVVDEAPGLVLQGDPVRVAQILSNLLNNAAKYTPEGGQVTVAVHAEHGTGMALARVADTGIGMEPSLLARVFDLFVQAEATPERFQGGLGIGLALARSLAQQHGGSLVASSPGPGQGSVFELRLPLAG